MLNRVVIQKILDRQRDSYSRARPLVERKSNCRLELLMAVLQALADADHSSRYCWNYLM
jgi:hypothetical protein